MIVRFWIEEIEFYDGTKVPLEKNDIIVFVGPNNVGKSASLRELNNLLISKINIGKVVKDINIEREGDEEGLLDFLDKNSTKDRSMMPPDIRYLGFRYNIPERKAKENWSEYKNGINDLSYVFVNIVGTGFRLEAANPAPNIKLTTEVITYPIHFLQKDDKLEQQFSDYFKQAFGKDLIVHRNAGKEVPLYVGKKPIPKHGEDRISSNYLRELEKLELLKDQGDGMRSFVGLLLETLILNHSILFIDEPDAFLHPPQARLLAKMLAKDLPSQKQLFVATHSEDFLKGLLDANVPNLKIIRIQRDDSRNKISALNSLDIEKIWKDSLLRHSNILSGLFHTKVVICESDSDCRFYSAMLSSLYESIGEISSDILFIHCGGKDRIPMVVKSLMKLDVPLKVIADFDVLNETEPLKGIFTGMGGEWSTIAADWKTVKTSIDKKRPELQTSDLKQKIDAIFGSVSTPNFPKEKVTQINKELRKSSAWALAKEGGKSFIPSGDETKAFDRLQSKLKNVGLLVLDVGELEGFVKSVGNHGPKWVNEVLKKDLKNDHELETARKFIKQLIE